MSRHQLYAGYPIALGKRVNYLGRHWIVSAVGMHHHVHDHNIGAVLNERYYWLRRGRGEVAMVPASLLEQRAGQ